MTIAQHLDTEFCNFLCAWDMLEKNLGDSSIISLNLPEYSSQQYTFQNRQEVLEALNDFLGEEGISQDRLFYQRVYGLRAYLLDVLNNQTTPFQDYLRDTMGLELVYFPDEMIEAQHDKIQPKTLPQNCAPASAPLENIEVWFAQYFEESARDISDLLCYETCLPKPNLDLIRKDSPMLGSIGGQGRQFSLKLNAEPPFLQTENEFYMNVLHEVSGHAYHGAALLDQIEKGKLPTNRGMTCEQGFEAFHREGLAEYASIYFGRRDDPHYQYLVEGNYYRRMVMNNMIYLGNVENETDEQVRKYCKEHLPNYKDGHIDLLVQRFLHSNSMYRAYAPIYAPAMHLFKHVMDHLDETSQRTFLQTAYTTLLDPKDLYDLGLKLGVPKLDNFKPVRPDAVEQAERKNILRSPEREYPLPEFNL